MAMRAIAPSTRKVYDAKWEAFRKWCKKEKIKHPTKATQQEVLSFLSLKAKTVKYATIKGYLTALSRQHRGITYGGKCHKLSFVESIQTWLKGLQQFSATTRSRTPQWCLELVLKTLTKPPYFPVDKRRTDWRKLLTRRAVFLTAITSARRTSELHAIQRVDLTGVDVRLWLDPTFKPKINKEWHRNCPIVVPAMFEEKDPYLSKLCVRTALKDYLNATKTLRAGADTSNLFLCHGKKYQGKPASRKTISRWLVETVNDSYEKNGLEKPFKVTGHQVRGQAASWAVHAGLDPQTICDAATWASQATFAKSYSLNVAYQKQARFGRSVLRSAIAEMRSSDRARAHAVTTQGQRQSARKSAGITQGYVIPRVSHD